MTRNPIRVLIEISLPGKTLGRVEEELRPAHLPGGVSARLEVLGSAPGCQQPAVGGEQDWVPCWLTVETDGSARQEFERYLKDLRQVLVTSAKQGGLTLHCVAANVQAGERFFRTRDVLDVLEQTRN